MTHEELFERMDREVEQWRTDVARAREDLEGHFRGIESAIKDLTHKSAQSNAHAEAVEAAQARIEALEAELVDRLAELEAAHNRAADLEILASDLAARLTRAEDEQAAALGRLGDLEEKARQAAEELRQREQRHDEMTGQARQLDQKVAELTAELSAREREAEARGPDEHTQAIEQELERMTDELETAHGQLAQARKELGAHPPLGQLEELHRLLAEERERADLLERRIERRAETERDAGAAEQVANALRDRDEAHQEIVALRAEVDMLRRANASLATPASDDDRDELAAALDSMGPEGGRRRMGEILVALGLITREQLAEALRSQDDRPQRRLGAILIDKGFTSQEVVARVLARQLELPFVRLYPETIAQGASALINAALARRHQCIPIGVSPTHVTLAMANPFDLVALDDVQMATSRRAEPVVAAPADVAAAIARCYGAPPAD